MKRKFSIPYVNWRNDRPRFSPGQKLRAMGYAGMDLRHPEGEKIKAAELQPGTKNLGAWFGPGEAMDWSAAFTKHLASLEKEQAAKPKAKPAAPSRPQASSRARPTLATAPRGSYPLSRLIEDWKNSPTFRDDKAPKTRSDYASKMNVLAEAYPDLWAAEADALDPAILWGIYEDMRVKRGLPMAKGTIRVLSSAISWGLRHRKFRVLTVNPAKDLGMKTPAPRVRFASRAELETLVAVADHVGRPDMGDSFIAAVWSGQRQGDRLALKVTEERHKRLVCRQSKTGAIVSIPIAPEFQRRRTAAALRRKEADVVSNQLVLFEKTWRPFTEDTYRHYFAEIRTIAVHGLWRLEDGTLRCPVNSRFKHLNHVGTGAIPGPGRDTCLVKPCRSLEDFHEADFRDTAVTWLGMAGATVPEICSVTGHSVASATQVLKHYLAMHADMADSAIAKMVAWYEKDVPAEEKL